MQSPSRQPRNTYRLQIRESFTLDDAAAVLDYLDALGVDWLYLSPLLVAHEGSDHGYDVVDHSTVDPRRGGAEALTRLAAAARERGRGILVDIVPNHVGVEVPHENPWWWDLLLHGSGSRYAEAFDVDWAAGEGRIRIPVLGDDADALQVTDGELRYHEHRFPLAPGTGDGTPAEVHDRQHYELVHWTRADAELNYRRFFAVNTLAGIRVEVPWVFDESHREVLRWVREDLVHGMRIDHPDGLAHPGAYLHRLAEASGGAYVVVEKILEGRERLPESWPVAGTTGYDALGDVDRVLVDERGQAELDAFEDVLHGGGFDWHEEIYRSKRAIADGILRSEVLRLTRMLADSGAAGPGADPEELAAVADTVAELLAAFPVYRSYLPDGAEHLQQAIDAVRSRRSDLTETLDIVVPFVSDPQHPAAVRFQQTSGMVMAKGVEDTAFYRYSRLTSLNEVGAEPAEFAIPAEEYHERQRYRLEHSPASMTTLSTHDTKRSEDVRARLNVLAEIPGEWIEVLRKLRRMAPMGEPPLENLLWQAIIGAWPASRERLHAYAEKAAREANTATGWAAPNEEFEQAMHAAIDAAFDDPAVNRLIGTFLRRIMEPGWSNALSAKLLQLVAPGVPDVYQGSELWDLSLVDPDNRRPVDFEQRRALLANLDAGWLPEVDHTGAAKLLVTSRVLRLRRDNPDLFTDYRPVTATGLAERHVVAADHGGVISVATRLPLTLAQDGGWATTVLQVPAGRWVDVLTGAAFAGPDIALSALLDRYPVALLRRAADDTGDATTPA